MTFIFEDNSLDFLSRLFLHSYHSSTIDLMKYAKGNGNLLRIAKNTLQSTSDLVIVYLDTIPGNPEIFDIYHNLTGLSRYYDGRLIVMPIICAEYYFLKSMVGTDHVTNHEEVRRCVNKVPYFDSSLISTEADKKYCRNFEKYCKLVLLKCTRVFQSKRQDLELVGTDIADMSIRLLTTYPVVPKELSMNFLNTVSIETCKKIRIKLVNEFNTFVDVLREADDDDIGKDRKYKYLKV